LQNSSVCIAQSTRFASAGCAIPHRTSDGTRSAAPLVVGDALRDRTSYGRDPLRVGTSIKPELRMLTSEHATPDAQGANPYRTTAECGRFFRSSCVRRRPETSVFCRSSFSTFFSHPWRDANSFL